MKFSLPLIRALLWIRSRAVREESSASVRKGSLAFYVVSTEDRAASVKKIQGSPSVEMEYSLLTRSVTTATASTIMTALTVVFSPAAGTVSFSKVRTVTMEIWRKVTAAQTAVSSLAVETESFMSALSSAMTGMTSPGTGVTPANSRFAETKSSRRERAVMMVIRSMKMAVRTSVSSPAAAMGLSMPRSRSVMTAMKSPLTAAPTVVNSLAVEMGSSIAVLRNVMMGMRAMKTSAATSAFSPAVGTASCSPVNVVMMGTQTTMMAAMKNASPHRAETVSFARAPKLVMMETY